MRATFGAVSCALALGGLACSSSDPSSADEMAQDAAAGSRAIGDGGGTGGSQASGGSKATGGAKGTGGSQAAGGSPATGGSQATGGSKGTGGSQATGGSTGTGGDAGPPHVVGACSGLGAIDDWENVTPASVNASQGMGILNVLSDPVHAGTVYIGTDKQGIHKSTDCGATWVKVNTGRNGAAMDSGQQWSMAIDPVEPNVIFSGALYGTDLGLLKSTNGGVDWDSVFPPGGEVANMVDYTFLQEVSMDPTDHKHLVVSFHANCKGAYAPMCLAETKDSGATWRLLKGPLGSWAEASRPLVIGATSWLFATMMDGLFYTKDSGATWEKVGQAGGHQLYRASDGTYYLGGYVGVQRSPDGHAWSTVQGTPGWADAIIGDGSRIFVSGKVSDNHPFFTSPENDGKNWTKVTAATLSGGADVFAYDADHHVIYASAPSVGVVRAVTK